MEYFSVASTIVSTTREKRTKKRIHVFHSLCGWRPVWCDLLLIPYTHYSARSPSVYLCLYHLHRGLLNWSCKYHTNFFLFSLFVPQNFMWNTITVQYNPLIEEEFDEHFKVTCEYGYDFWKTVTFPFLDVE